MESTPVFNELQKHWSVMQAKAKLEARVELLKLAQKQTIIDAYGNDVPKVGTTPRKSSITVKF